MHFKQWIEARIFKGDETPDNVEPLKSGDTFRVYHGINNWADALNIAMYGLSGKMKAKRSYSYEANNNPHGLFVTLDFKKAKQFTSVHTPSVIIEFHARVSDLEPPVWPDGGYTIQGELSQSFKNRHERSKALQQRNQFAKQLPHPSIAQSDHPYLAQMLFANHERQALFVGDLSPQQIKRFWVADEPDGKLKMDSTFQPISPKEFIRLFGNKSKEGLTPTDIEAQNRVFRPNEDWNPELFISRLSKQLKMDQNRILKGLESIWQNVMKQGPGAMQYSSLKRYLWPRQMPGAFNWLKTMFGSRKDHNG